MHTVFLKMSKVSSFVIICAISVIGVQNSYGQSATKFQLQGPMIATAFTPFDKKEKLNLSVIPQMARYYKSKNITGVYVSAYYGAGPSLNLKERKSLVKAWAKQANSLGFDLIVEIGAGPFVEVLAFAKFCSQNNVTALTAFPAVVYQPSVPSEEVEDLQRICDASNDVPLLYHELNIVGQEINGVQTYLSACNQVSCFAGVIASIDRLTILRASTNSTDCQFWVETSDQTAPGLILQMNAVASPATTLCPGLALDIAKAVSANDVNRALKLQQQSNDFVRAICDLDGGVLDYTTRTYFENMKAAFTMLTKIYVGYRYPMEKPNSTVIEQIRSNMASYNCY